MSFDANAYGPVFAELRSEDRLNDRSPGTPKRAAGTRLQALSAEQAFGHTALHDRILAEAWNHELILAGLASQYVAHLSHSVRQAIFGNVGALVVLRLGVEDARIVAKEMGDFAAQQILNLEVGEALVRAGGPGAGPGVRGLSHQSGKPIQASSPFQSAAAGCEPARGWSPRVPSEGGKYDEGISLLCANGV